MECSTPFGIRDCCTPKIEIHCGTPIMCSTPFGIRDCCTFPRNSLPECENACSTPFGIRDCCTGDRRQRRRCGGGVLNAFRHQRLLHSRRPRSQRRATGCSTPFGIRDCCTAMRLNRLSEFNVLNAFRHQRLLHRFASSQMVVFGCAQRLSASEIAARLQAVRNFETNVPCSTPFGIRDCCTLS